jgi:hypothetical protein
MKNKYTTVKSCHSSGKSFCAGAAVPLFLEAFVPSKVLTTAPTNFQVEKLIWAEVNNFIEKAVIPYPQFWHPLNKELKIAPDHFAIGFSSDENINYQGLHSENFLLVGDEAAGIEEGVYTAIETLMAGEGAHMLLISNPDSLSGTFYKSHEMKAFHKFTISAFSTPNFTAYNITLDDIKNGNWEEKLRGKHLPFPALISPEWVALVYDKWGHSDTSPMFVAKVLGEFPKSATDALIPVEFMNQACKRDARTHGTRQWGLDVARMGNDSSVLRYRRGEHLEITEELNKFDLVDLTEWSARIINRVDRNAPIAVDAVGLGSGVFDMLRRQQHLNVFEYKGNSSSHDEDCVNQRSEFFWHLRRLFVDGKISGNIDPETKEELSAMSYHIERGMVRVDKKDKIKKKINRSPDRADALMLCYAPIDNLSAVDDIVIPSAEEKPKTAKQEVEHFYPL